LAKRLAQVRLDAVVSSPMERCVQTAETIASAHADVPVHIDERFNECGYGDWTGQPLRKLVRDPLWRAVQAHPSSVTFPGQDGESMAGIQCRAVAGVRDWNARLGQDAVYLVCSHADVIKAILADSLGMHLDLFQRITIDPCSLSVIRYTPLRPFVERMNDTSGSVTSLIAPAKAKARASKAMGSTAMGSKAMASTDATVGGGAGG
jgi:probable phosphoglycerate mutase